MIVSSMETQLLSPIDTPGRKIAMLNASPFAVDRKLFT